MRRGRGGWTRRRRREKETELPRNGSSYTRSLLCLINGINNNNNCDDSTNKTTRITSDYINDALAFNNESAGFECLRKFSPTSTIAGFSSCARYIPSMNRAASHRTRAAVCLCYRAIELPAAARPSRTSIKLEIARRALLTHVLRGHGVTAQHRAGAEGKNARS